MKNITPIVAPISLPNVVSYIISCTLIVVGLIGAGTLLTWAVNDKLDKLRPIGSSAITAELRDRQLACLAKNVYYEAGGEPFEGKVAVAQVTLNRAASGKFPNDICQVIYQKNVIYEKVLCQFSWYCDRSTMARPVNPVSYNESVVVAKKVLMENYRLPSLTEALFFHADNVSPNWGKTKVAQIGHHIFYK